MKNSELKIVVVFKIFVDMEKAFDQVPREVICSALSWKGVLEYLVNDIMSLYKDCNTIKFIFCKSWCPSRVWFE